MITDTARQPSVHVVGRLIERQERELLLEEVTAFINFERNRFGFENETSSPLIETVFNALHETLNQEQPDQAKLELLFEVIELMVNNKYLEALNISKFIVPMNIDFFSDTELASNLNKVSEIRVHEYIIDSARDEVRAELLNPLNLDYPDRLTQQIIFDANLSAISADHQAVFIPERLGDQLDVEFEKRRYYTFKIDD